MFEMFHKEMIECTRFLNKEKSFLILVVLDQGALPFDPKFILAANKLLGSKRLILSNHF